jgi:hypothetical protein
MNQRTLSSSLPALALLLLRLPLRLDSDQATLVARLPNGGNHRRPSGAAGGVEPS